MGHVVLAFDCVVGRISTHITPTHSPLSPTPYSPPCDGRCPLLSRPTAEYAATLLMYPKTAPPPPRQPGQKVAKEDELPRATGPTAWKFTLQGGEEAAFVSGGNDAVLLVYKSGSGYSPEMLPRLVPCPMVEGTLTVTRWVPRRAPVEAVVAGNGEHDEL